MLKDKEAQHGGLMNDGESGPLSENIFHIRNKYQQIQRQLEEQIDTLAHENKELNARNGTLMVNLEQAVAQRSDYEVHTRKATNSYDTETDRLRKAISMAEYEAAQTTQQTKVFVGDREDGRTRAGEYKLQINKIKLEINTMEEQLGTIDEEKEKNAQELNKKILDLTIQLRGLEREKSRNTAELSLQTQNEELKQKQNELILEQDSCKNRISMLKHSKTVAKNKTKQLIIEKKELQDEINSVQAALEQEKSATNSTNSIDEMVKDKEQQEVLVARNNVSDAQSDARFQQEVSKRKQDENTSLNERNNELKFKLEQKQLHVAKIRKNNMKTTKALMKLDAEHRENQIKSREIEVRNEDMKDKIERSRQEGKTLLIENQTLKEKVNYLLQKLEINEQLKNIDLDELKSQAKANYQMNQQLNSLVSKWDSVRQQNEFEVKSREEF